MIKVLIFELVISTKVVLFEYMLNIIIELAMAILTFLEPNEELYTKLFMRFTVLLVHAAPPRNLLYA